MAVTGAEGFNGTEIRHAQMAESFFSWTGNICLAGAGIYTAVEIDTGHYSLGGTLVALAIGAVGVVARRASRGAHEHAHTLQAGNIQ